MVTEGTEWPGAASGEDKGIEATKGISQRVFTLFKRVREIVDLVSLGHNPKLSHNRHLVGAYQEIVSAF